MEPKEKTRRIMQLLEGRSFISPFAKTVDPSIAGIDFQRWGEIFSNFDEKQVQAASKLINILLDVKEFRDFINLAEGIQGNANDRLFLYVLYSTVLHRDDCKGVLLPPIEEIAPHWFFAAETIHDAIQNSIHGTEAVLINQSTAEKIEPESRLAYFREDIGINAHHWHWHIVFPLKWDHEVTMKMKDRQGEIFYYMHEQMLARYNCERLANDLNRVVPLQNFRDVLPGYAPHLISEEIGKNLGSRPPGLIIRNIPDVSLEEMEAWKMRIFDAIDNKFVHDVKGNLTQLDTEKGIHTLACLVEANSSSINRNFYGNLHNMGHILISQVHDPDGRFRELPGVMAFTESAVRDPIFFQWHKFLDELFVRHKLTLKPYTKEELSMEGIKISSVDVKADETNVLETFMTTDHADISRAPFLRKDQKILIRYQRLDYKPFTYSFQIENKTDEGKEATIRVFLSPRYDETGEPLGPNEQRRLMVELDKFQRHLAPGPNVITRHSSDSSVTIPIKRHNFTELKEGNYNAEVDYCYCGWPANMLIPRGTRAGMEFSLFVMCTDYANDRPEEDNATVHCDGSISYCGAQNQKYPDKRPMGFPFDRFITADTLYTEDFRTENMFFTDVKIKFLG